MQETNRGESPGSAVAEPVTVTEAAKAESGSLPEPSLQEVQNATTPLELQRALRSLKPGTAQPAPAAKAEVEEIPAEALKPKVETEETPETPETPEAAPEDEETPEGGAVTPVKSKRPHVKVNEEDEHGRLTLAYQIRNKDWTLKQASEAADKQLGLNKGAAKPTEAKAETQESTLPQSVEEVNRQIADLRAKKKANATELRLEDVEALNDQITDLFEHRRSLEQANQAKQSQEVASYEAGFSASEAKAIDLYAFASDPKSAGGQRMVEIEESLRETNDPIFSDPNKPLIIAQMVAKELQIAPKSKVKPAPAKAAPVTPAVPAPKKQVLPGNGARTETPVSDPNGLNKKIESVSSIAELRKLQKSLGMPH